MKIQFPEAVDRPSTISVGDDTIAVDADGIADVTAAVWRMVEHTGAVVVGYDPGEADAAAHLAAFGAPVPEPVPDTVLMIQTDGLGIETRIRVNPAQVEAYENQGWKQFVPAAPQSEEEETDGPVAPDAADLPDGPTGGSDTPTAEVTFAGIRLTDDPERPLFVASDGEMASGVDGARWLVEEHGDGTATVTPSVNWPGKFHTANPVTTTVLQQELANVEQHAAAISVAEAVEE